MSVLTALTDRFATGTDRRRVLGVGAAVLLAGSAMILLRRLPDRAASIPDTDESAVVFMCEHCAHTYSMTAHAVAEAWRASGTVRRSTAGALRTLVLRCPECGEIAARQASLCPADGTAFLASWDDPPTPCPRCGLHESALDRRPQRARRSARRATPRDGRSATRSPRPRAPRRP